MVEIPEDYYVFIIDTDSYSGNFEREMCAYLTGMVDNSDVGREYTELYEQETGKDPYEVNEHILFMPGEYGERPCTIMPTPGKWPDYQSVGIFMSRKPTEEEIKILKERANKFQLLEDYKKNETPKILGFRLIQMKTTEVEIPI
jgi:hypothetical protein